MIRNLHLIFIVTIITILAGCQGNPTPATIDTGARRTGESFYESLIAGQTSLAYEVLDAECQRRVSIDQFAVLARAYVKSIGFTAQKVHIHASDEQGDSATIHVTISGHSNGHSRRFSDGITLNRTNGKWTVHLPANFGHKLSRPK